MRKLSQPLSTPVEFGVVVGIAFGYPIIISLLCGFGVQQQKVLTAHNLLFLSGFELSIGALLLFFLWLQGWTPRKIGLSPTFRDTGIGLLLLLTTSLAWFAIFYATYFISPQTVAHMRETYAQLKGGGAPAGAVVGTSFVNALYEEIFVSGYVITALKPWRGSTLALNVSVAIRLLYHLYQGQMAVLGILPIGLIYAYWYARTGRLWPLIVAHTTQDILTLLMG